MPTQGTAPLDPASPIGQVRLTIGDTSFDPLSPPVDGQGIYEWFSDLEIAQFLLSGSGSVLRATGLAIKQLALGASLKGYAIKTDDLSLDASKRGAGLLDVAASYLADADAEDTAADSSFFQIVDFAGYAPSFEPEALVRSPFWRV